MQRIELKNLLPSGTVADRTRSDVLGDLVVTSTSVASEPAPEGAGETATSIAQGPAKDVAELMSTLASQITSQISTQQTQIGATQDNTQALTQNTSSKSGSSAASMAGNIASSILGSGLALSPIISGLMGLFGGGTNQSSATAPSPFQLPAPVRYDAGLTGSLPGQAAPVTYNAAGQPRVEAVKPAPQITVQVNAMDSQSFLDHSDEIARAVKEALLHSNALNDVISDL